MSEALAYRDSQLKIAREYESYSMDLSYLSIWGVDDTPIQQLLDVLKAPSVPDDLVKKQVSTNSPQKCGLAPCTPEQAAKRPRLSI